MASSTQQLKSTPPAIAKTSSDSHPPLQIISTEVNDAKRPWAEGLAQKYFADAD